MIHLEVGGERYVVSPGETVIGSDPGSAVVLGGEGVQPRHAVVQATPPNSAAIRVADRDAEVKVNGVRLGAEPTPLLHGDKISIGQHELRVVDSSRVGSTQLFDSGAFTDLAPPKVTKPAVGSTGGRLVCLTDGREYKVGSGPLTFGRDAGSNVVVSGNEVSRTHAEIRSDAEGYLLIDLSANGTYVNGERIGKTHKLARADVIRIGNDEFRFYADPPARTPVTPPPAPSNVPASPGAAHRLSDTMFGIPMSTEAQPEANSQRSTPAPATPGAPLASFLLRSGDFKGRRLPIKAPVVNIGRADHNDVVLADPSVSATHAKLQRRDAIWILSDLGSTNGTFVEGERLNGETPLSPGTTIKFGDVAALFEPLDESVQPKQANRTRKMEPVVVPPPAEPAAEPVVPEPVAASRERPRPRRPIHHAPPRPRSPSTITIVGLLILVAILAYLLSSY